MTRSPFKATALLLLALLMAGASWAQDLRPTETLYFTPRVGISSYLGDNDPDVDFDEWGAVDGIIPLYGGLEIGYQYTKSFAVGFGVGISALPTSVGPDIGAGDRAYLKDETQGAFLKYPFYLTTRFQTPGNVSPYIELGAGGAVTTFNRTGDTGNTRLAYGPQVGVGVDFFFNPRTAFTIGLQSLFTFPDEVIDSDEFNRDRYGAAVRDFASFDLVNNLSLGLKFNNKKAFTPVDVMGVNCPSTLQVGQSGTFEAMVNMNATMPVEYRWDFGDGNMGTGLVATRSYDRAGTYIVTFTSSNGRSMDSESCTVTVVAPPVAASVVSINSSPNPASACTAQTVRFSSNVRGDTPLDYMWNFGDGTTGTGANPTHVYSQPGSYTVSLTVRNNAGSDTATLTQVVEACAARNPCADIAELNSAYFMNNSSVLTAEARAELMENVEVLRDCACIMTRIEGFAGPRERNPQSLSEARANAVMQFYVDNGISASQLSMSGMGRVGATTTKKDDTSQFRRVDSIPMTSDCNSTMDN